MTELTMPTVHVDERGILIAVELDDLPFTARRMFVVTGSPAGTVRADHVIPCSEFIVLVSGSVSLQFGPDAEHLCEPVVLDRPGSSLELTAGQYLRYTLADEHSTIAVVAAEPHARDS